MTALGNVYNLDPSFYGSTGRLPATNLGGMHVQGGRDPAKQTTTGLIL